MGHSVHRVLLTILDRRAIRRVCAAVLPPDTASRRPAALAVRRGTGFFPV